MTSDWKECCLGNVISLIIDHRGLTPKKLGGDWSNSGYRALSAKNIKTGKIVQQEDIRFVDEIMYHRWMAEEIQRGDIIITSEAPFGEILQWKSDEKIVLSQRLFAIRPNSSVDSTYLYYYMTTSAFQGELHARATGTTVIGLRQPELLKCKIRVPELPVQKRIASILSALDDKIELNERINKNLEEQAQALFKAWFVDYSVFKGEMPVDWKEYSLKEFLPVITGKKNANVSSADGKYPFFSCSQDIAWTDEYSFEGNAILVAGNGDFNVKFYNGKFEAYQRTYVLIPYNPRYTAWLYYAVKHNLDLITAAARGSVIKFITKGNLENFAFYAPIDLDNCEIIDCFSAINNQIAGNRTENARLAELRDSLMSRLMGGKLDVAKIVI